MSSVPNNLDELQLPEKYNQEEIKVHNTKTTINKDNENNSNSDSHEDEIWNSIRFKEEEDEQYLDNNWHNKYNLPWTLLSYQILSKANKNEINDISENQNPSPIKNSSLLSKELTDKWDSIEKSKKKLNLGNLKENPISSYEDLINRSKKNLNNTNSSKLLRCKIAIDNNNNKQLLRCKQSIHKKNPKESFEMYIMTKQQELDEWKLKNKNTENDFTRNIKLCFNENGWMKDDTKKSNPVTSKTERKDGEKKLWIVNHHYNTTNSNMSTKIRSETMNSNDWSNKNINPNSHIIDKMRDVFREITNTEESSTIYPSHSNGQCTKYLPTVSSLSDWNMNFEKVLHQISSITKDKIIYGTRRASPQKGSKTPKNEIFNYNNMALFRRHVSSRIIKKINDNNILINKLNPNNNTFSKANNKIQRAPLYLNCMSSRNRLTKGTSYRNGDKLKNSYKYIFNDSFGNNTCKASTKLYERNKFSSIEKQFYRIISPKSSRLFND